MVTVVIALVVAVGIASNKHATYSADAILLVNPGASATSPGSPQEAQGLAATYAGLIPNDSAVLGAVASATGLTPSQVQSETTVTVVNGTSLLDIRFTDASSITAKVGVTAMATAISGKTPVTKAIPGGTVTITREASGVTTHATKLSTIALLGLLLGLLLGAVIIIVWERADARFDAPGQVSGALGIPARSFDSLNPGSVTALLDRWKTLALHEPATVALISAVPGIKDSTALVAHRIGLRATSDMALIAVGAPGTEGGDSEAHRADLSVLVVPRGAPVRQVHQALQLLAHLGVHPSWALMVNVRRLRASAQRPSQLAKDTNRAGTAGAASLPAR